MKRFRKIYLEISNICNLKCSFCPGTKRPPKIMTEEEFSFLLSKLHSWTDFLYFHLMGEPLGHPNLESFLQIATEHSFKVILTTNGTLLKKQQEILLSSPALHKVNISLHAFEANDLAVPFQDYLNHCFSFGQAAQGKKLIVYRLWNQGGADKKNDVVLKTMEDFFPSPWIQERRGTRIAEKTYLEYGDKFDWPDLSAEDGGAHVFCYGLQDQVGILSDGSVVPCCLDHDGELVLGNLFTDSMDDILTTPRAQAIYQGFQNKLAAEELCRKCGYARRFK